MAALLHKEFFRTINEDDSALPDEIKRQSQEYTGVRQESNMTNNQTVDDMTNIEEKE